MGPKGLVPSYLHILTYFHFGLVLIIASTFPLKVQTWLFTFILQTWLFTFILTTSDTRFCMLVNQTIIYSSLSFLTRFDSVDLIINSYFKELSVQL
jgi:hypothetical protein